jgi:Lrp/AsnC family transcriptional regulator for asnA, asnC and gidA
LYQLDEIDMRIIQKLQEDAKTPFTKIGKELEIPDTTVHFRVKKLLENDIIRKFTVMVNHEKLGYTVRALLRIEIEKYLLDMFTQSKVEEVVEELSKVRSGELIARCESKNEIIAIISTRNSGELINLMETLRKKEGIRDLDVSVIDQVFEGVPGPAAVGS